MDDDEYELIICEKQNAVDVSAVELHVALAPATAISAALKLSTAAACAVLPAAHARCRWKL